MTDPPDKLSRAADRYVTDLATKEPPLPDYDETPEEERAKIQGWYVEHVVFGRSIVEIVRMAAEDWTRSPPLVTDVRRGLRQAAKWARADMNRGELTEVLVQRCQSARQVLMSELRRLQGLVVIQGHGMGIPEETITVEDTFMVINGQSVPVQKKKVVTRITQPTPLITSIMDKLAKWTNIEGMAVGLLRTDQSTTPPANIIFEIPGLFAQAMTSAADMQAAEAEIIDITPAGLGPGADGNNGSGGNDGHGNNGHQ